MKRFIFLAILLAAGFFGYQYYTTGTVDTSALMFWKKDAQSSLPTKDEKGNPLVPCPKCAGTGQGKCTAPRCKEGKVPCPGKCLKESDCREHWPKPVPGHSPDELWAIFHFSHGRTQGLTKSHKGELVGVRNGEFFNDGPCPLCQGTSVVDCKVCKGTALVVCPVCHGSKVVAAPRKPGTPALPPPTNTVPRKAAALPPGTASTSGPIHLKNGKTLNGTVIIRDETTTWIRTDDGQRIEVKSPDVLSY